MTKITRESGQEAVVATYLHWKFLMVEYCTGFGKTNAALQAVGRGARERRERSRGIIITHSEPARDITWPEQIRIWAPDLYECSDVLIVCYASLRNIAGEKFDWAICDECHYLTPHNAVFFDRNSVYSIILMSGTLPDDPEKMKIIRRLSNNRKLTISLDDAVRNNILNNYRITVWNIKLSPEEWQEYLNECAHVDWSVGKGNQLVVDMARGSRARLIYNMESKYQAACYVRDKIREAGRRMFIFTGSKQIANRLSPYRYYEGTGNHHFIDFMDGNISELVSIKMIQEGANVDNVEAALMQQLNSKSLNFMQKLGRLMRLDPDQVARIHIICAVDTYDANWVRQALSKADPKKITYRNLPRELFIHYV